MTTATAPLETQTQLSFDLRDAMTPTGFDFDAFQRIESVEEIIEVAQTFGLLNSQVRWNVGDFLNFVEGSRFADAYDQILSAFGLARRTIDNWRWVAGAVARSRRRETLSWSHHEAVASMLPRSQRAWLDRAEKKGWNVDELRDAIRAENGDADEGEGGGEAGPSSVQEAARRVWNAAQKDGDRYLVPVEDMLALARSIGAA